MKKDIELKQKKIDHIMDEFDFTKVQKVMKFLNWTYCIEAGGWENDMPKCDIPTESDLRKTLRGLLNDCYHIALEDGHGHISTGGFDVYIVDGVDGEEGDYSFVVKFIIEEMNFY